MKTTAADISAWRRFWSGLSRAAAAAAAAAAATPQGAAATIMEDSLDPKHPQKPLLDALLAPKPGGGVAGGLYSFPESYLPLLQSPQLVRSAIRWCWLSSMSIAWLKPCLCKLNCAAAMVVMC
jgi:hypothetical protein